MANFFKLDPYREYVFPPDLEKWFAAVENALGFKLFFWQKTFIERAVFRCYGETTARILRELSQINELPIDLRRYKTIHPKERIYCEELLRIKETLDNAGVPTREVWTCEKDRNEWLIKQEEKRLHQAMGIPKELLGPREMKKFWDF